MRFGDALELPFADNSVDVIYSSHMLEHLDRDTARSFLQEASRALRPGGIVRLAIPDLAHFVDAYQADGDADTFIASLLMSQPLPRNWQQRARSFALGFRDHRWMYDRKSLVKLLQEAGFDDVRIMEPGQSGIENPGELDLSERSEESIYAEGRAPRHPQ